ncbi:response regulator [bacterium]|nr:response regulator [bacterium]
MANGKRVLVVDDDADVRNYLEMALEDDGFEVETAENGRIALEKIWANPPDLISLDLVMPEFSGAKLNRELQKNSKLASIPVLIVTGHAQDDLGKADLDELTMSGPGVYLEKPVKPSSYVAAVRKLLGMEQSEKVEQETMKLRKELEDTLKNASLDSMKEILEALKKKS